MSCFVSKHTGTGASGVVHRGKYLETEVAVKTLRYDGRLSVSASDNKAAKELFDETRILKRMRHPNIVRIFLKHQNIY